MSDPTQGVWSAEQAMDHPSPAGADGGAFCKKFTQTTRADDELSESGSESTFACPSGFSQGLDSWCLADGSWSPGDLRAEARPPAPAPACGTPAAERGAGAGPEGAGAAGGGFFGAAGGAAATAAAAAAAANAVAARRRLEQREREPEPEGREGRGGEAARAPPGLPGPPPGSPGSAPPAPPSRGSGAHVGGDCSPCVWHWKPQGCLRGRECGYCHLCPEGEIKLRKKAKLATLRSSSRGLQDSSEAEQQAQEQDEASPAEAWQGASSVGSTLHATGECRPCAWFWKPQGCQNGQECRHCHLCPEGEIKLRKKLKVETMRQDPLEDEFDQEAALEVQEDPHEPVKVITGNTPGDGNCTVKIPPPPGLAEPTLKATAAEVQTVSPESTGDVPSVGSIVHGTGECRPCAWFWKPQGCQNGRECRHCHLCPEGEIKARKKGKAESSRQGPDEQQPQQQQPWGECMPETLGLGACAPPFLPLPPLPSIGSSLHGTGLCRPCAWFWKPQGCENGRECCHCHLCPNGEIRARRKLKVAVLRHQGPPELGCEAWGAPWGAPGEGLASEEEAASPEADASPAYSEGVGHSPFMPPVPLDLSASLDSPLPSTGSALHSLGKCRPCAWFWKSTGCLNGQACAHCHLCPEGELKVRKKVKETAMRIGALLPARRGLDARSPRVVRIAPVLGA